MPEAPIPKSDAPRRECGERSPDGDGKVCRRVCAPGRDDHGGGHWFADPGIDGETVRRSVATWIVTGATHG